MLTVGIPREIKPLEKRVALTPEAVRELTGKGIDVYVESTAGAGSGFTDLEYKKCGAMLLPNAASLYRNADIIQKVKEPQPSEYRLLRDDQILFSFLHLASPDNCKLLKVLVRSLVTAIGYETLKVDGRLPILAPMSEIAGGLSVAYAAYFRQHIVLRGKEIIYPNGWLSKLEGIAAVYPNVSAAIPVGEVVIFGGGVAGRKAVEVARKLGAGVTVVDTSKAAREEFLALGIRAVSPDDPLLGILSAADVLIGAAHTAGTRAARVISEASLKLASSKHKKLIMDIAIDQGGNFPEARSTTYEQPLYLDSYGNLRFSVTNIPSLCGRMASERISTATLPYTTELAIHPVQTLLKMPEMMEAINIQAGKIMKRELLAAHKL